MKIRIIMLAILSLTILGSMHSNANGASVSISQNDLLAEYEQRFILIEKQFADYKKQLDPAKMSTLEGKMKVGAFENSRNALKAKLRDLRKSGAPLSETDKGDLDKKFETLTVEFEQLKKATE